ncbi:alkaline phosphatase D family protein [uncultured Maribacter sp.]|uniref:alkaline phosphatase D family protein n=1 Tax=uncultured Maribacter sp. TaxID=431308 RepID=UPI00260C29D9|nr:alkaline phosphatase D family protein [uncultured Maribacter sp.]
MNKIIGIWFAMFFLFACNSIKSKRQEEKINNVVLENDKPDFVMTFGSCNKTTIPNKLWDDVLRLNPDVWIWGGDIIYADTENKHKLRNMYEAQNKVPLYALLKEKVPVIGTWDDHDYGLNDGGVEFRAKKESQEEFLDFMNVPKDSPRRNREGIYASHMYKVDEGTVKVIVLDTRYFRTGLTKDTQTKRRHKANIYGQGTILGEKQWLWLREELKNSKADFNVILSSIQVLSNQHGFECWGNFPHEVDKLKETIVASKARGVILLSGDRHISEFSKTRVKNLVYPLIDFTSSGLTHAYSGYKGEENPFRLGSVVFTESFGLLNFDFQQRKVNFQIIGDQGRILEKTEQRY